jgi:gas vesicle protein
MSTQKILIGTMTGIVAGIALGLLVAPAKGSETREKLSDLADNLKKKLKNIRGTTADELDELKEIFERETTGLKDDVRERVLSLIKAAKTSSNNIKEEALS